MKEAAATIAELRAELEEEKGLADRWYHRTLRAEADRERKDAALREIAKGEGGVVTGAAVIARRALATGADQTGESSHEWENVSYHGSPDWECKHCGVEKRYDPDGNVHEKCPVRATDPNAEEAGS